MSKAASLPRSRPVKASPKGYLPDRIAGGLTMALDAARLLMLGMSARGAYAAHLVPTRETTVTLAVLTADVVAHFGVFRGLRWGFALAAALAAWGLVDVSVGPHVALSTDLWMLLYAAFRLGSAYGPKAR